jgi:hypothetical protein
VFATSRCRVLRSWDLFHLAKPFGRGAFIWGKPIEVEPELDEAGLERARLLVERRMNEMARDADRRVGRGSEQLRDLPSAPSGTNRRLAALPTLYRAMTAALTPLVLLYLKRREQRGKEDRARVGERLGIASARRPSAQLVWIHTASVGEATSVLALMALSKSGPASKFWRPPGRWRRRACWRADCQMACGINSCRSICRVRLSDFSTTGVPIWRSGSNPNCGPTW